MLNCFPRNQKKIQIKLTALLSELMEWSRFNDFMSDLFTFNYFLTLSLPQSVPQMRPSTCHMPHAPHALQLLVYSTFHFQFAWYSVSHKARRLWLTRVAGATETFIIHKAERRQQQSHSLRHASTCSSNTNTIQYNEREREGEIEREKALCFNGLISGPVVKPTFEYWPGLKWSMRGVVKQFVICTHTHACVACPFVHFAAAFADACPMKRSVCVIINKIRTRLAFYLTLLLFYDRGRPGAVARGGGLAGKFI